jgi:hypothetical protein
MLYNPYTNKPSPETLKILEREQNLQFIDYCPKCNEWMEKEITHMNYVKSYTCKICNTKRFQDENLIINRKIIEQIKTRS